MDPTPSIPALTAAVTAAARELRVAEDHRLAMLTEVDARIARLKVAHHQSRAALELRVGSHASRWRDASAAADAAALRALLDRGADPDAVINDASGSTALLAAAAQGQLEIVRLLLDAGATPDKARTNNGSTPLYTSAAGGHLAAARLLISRGAALDLATSDTGTSPLYGAAKAGTLAVVRLLLDRGADPNQAKTSDGGTPLHTASLRGHVEIVRLLLRHGAAPNRATTSNGSTALVNAAQNGHLATARLLLDHGADPNKAMSGGMWAPVSAAACFGHLPMLQLLAAFGADLDHCHCKPRAAAQGRNQVTVVSWLDAVAGWAAIKIAVASRLHGAATSALRLGWIDPDGLASSMLVAVATSADHWPGGSPPICDSTTRFTRTQLGVGWAPQRHWVHHSLFRQAIETLLLAGERLRRNAERLDKVAADSSADSAAVTLPAELYLVVGSYMRRKDWVAVL